MTIPATSWLVMPHLHLAKGSTFELIGELDKRPDSGLAGMALFVAAKPGIRLAVGCVDHDSNTVSIPMPANLTVADLRLALWAYPVPALILGILRSPATTGEPVSADGKALIEHYKADFLDALVNRSSVARLAGFLKTRPTWRTCK